MGDVGYVDEAGKLWFCGRRAHIVETVHGRLFPVPCEAIVDAHPRVFRSTLVGIGEKPGQRPVFIVEPEPGCFPRTNAARDQFLEELRERTAGHPLTSSIQTFLFHHSLPVDTRHNVKIFREKLAPWAEKALARQGRP
jgi:acyl-coenzyme A synthetase/AMP-(fatty) acid ligase